MFLNSIHDGFQRVDVNLDVYSYENAIYDDYMIYFLIYRCHKQEERGIKAFGSNVLQVVLAYNMVTPRRRWNLR
jgi:hypothetical protein